MEILNDFNTTVEKALDEIDSRWRDYDGLIVCGTHSPEPVHIYEALEKIREYREKKKPFLGICFGHQLAAIEYGRNVLCKPVGSEEFDVSFPYNLYYIVKKLPQLNVGLKDGETYWNNYAVVDGFEDVWKKADNFITCQYHPEYQSSKDKPHPLLVRFIEVCKSE